MKRMLLVLSICSVALSVQAQHQVVARITNVRNDKGICRACLFDSQAALQSGRAFKCVQVEVRGREARAEFDGLPAGTYAILVFHDANRNNKMDRNFLGIPTEGYGASRNNLPFAAAPTFSDNQFTVEASGQTVLNIRLRNL